MTRKLTLGILAHVDAGKTSLSESLLFHSGKIRRPGRVDNRDAYLDTHALEKLRGITVFSKQAVFTAGDLEITLLDTPGHVDFSAEMERTLQVLDCALLVVSGPDGVQAHTRTLWRLLAHYGIPTFIFVNKMDQPGTDAAAILEALRQELGDGCVPFGNQLTESALEQLALCSEEAMEDYLNLGALREDTLRQLIAGRRAFPVFFGSALRQAGITELLEGMECLAPAPSYPEPFAARVFKISRDPQGSRLTHLKVTGGSLTVRDALKAEGWEEKITQIRLYSGDRYETPATVTAGTVCAVTGLTQTRPGQGLGAEAGLQPPVLEPFLAYRLILPAEEDPRTLLPKLRLLEEEEPALRLEWQEAAREIHVRLMGEVQLEILQALILERFGVAVAFGEGAVVYKETLAEPCEGVGHFEPLRHYAEVHLLLEPASRGSGLQFSTICSEELLDRNWQRQVLTSLQERTPVGVLTGSPVTDLRITLASGRAHARHTAGGDFREAACRALRQGLKAGRSLLLEPVYEFRLELPAPLAGKAMAAIDQMHGTCALTEAQGERAVLTGTAPVAAMRNYHREVAAFTRGTGHLTTVLKGYEVCHNPEAVIQARSYDSERDTENPTGSIFCTQGAGFHVPWDQVPAHMHLESCLKPVEASSEPTGRVFAPASSEPWISLEEIDRIIQSTYYANQGKKAPRRQKTARESYYEGLTSPAPSGPQTPGEEYLLVDGYNVIYAWPELKVLAEADLEAARLRLQDILCNYNGVRNIRIIVVFDAYRVAGRQAETEDYHNISLVFTAEAQTADQYIEKFAREHRQRLRITVATSDGLQQLIIRGAGSGLLSARELQEEVYRVLAQLEAEHLAQNGEKHPSLEDVLSEREKALLKGAT